MQREILQFPNPKLKLRSKEMDWLNGVENQIRDLEDTFRAYSGCIGLAAPQIGIEERIIVVDVTPSRSDTYLMINPVVIKESQQMQRVEDGCMSVGFGREYQVSRRPKSITVSWFDQMYAKRKQKFTGLIAACIHHEIDHLDGVLMFDRAMSVKGVCLNARP